jgi:hypothetical protein
MGNPADDTEEDKTTAVKRMRGLVKCWGVLLDENIVADWEYMAFNASIATRVVRHYIRDLNILKRRYNIENRAQVPKVAGLMANAILKYRPLVPIDGKRRDVEYIKANEALAIYHGLSVCANYGKSGDGNHKLLSDFMSKRIFIEWLKRFVYLLQERNYTSEALIMVFETLCMGAFPNSMTDEGIGD